MTNVNENSSWAKIVIHIHSLQNTSFDSLVNLRLNKFAIIDPRSGVAELAKASVLHPRDPGSNLGSDR
jgi:hypothetical protein